MTLLRSGGRPGGNRKGGYNRDNRGKGGYNRDNRGQGSYNRDNREARPAPSKEGGNA